MTGAKLSKPALVAILKVKQARGIKKFAQKAKVDWRTVQKMANGGYVEIGLIRKVEEALNATPTQVTAARVIEYTAAEYKITIDELMAGKGSEARQVAAWIIGRTVGLSDAIIADLLCYAGRTGVIKAEKAVHNLMDTDRQKRNRIYALLEKITN
jgi:chromosomal replication initiation ATPase DnaA